jgi:nuclear GTP-binding protein
MGKPGKKAGDSVGPSTNVNRNTSSIGKQTHLRTQRKIKVLKMYNARIKRDPQTGKIVSGSVLSASDRVERTMARIAPDRRWFGNTRVIGANALQTFRDEMKAKQSDPYSVVLKQSKLPLSLLDDPKNSTTVTNEMRYKDTFGSKATRKRVKLGQSDLAGMKQVAASKSEEYGTGSKDQQLVKTGDTGINDDIGTKRKLFEKGQSARIWGELFKVIDSSDVLLYVLDARDPPGTRSQFIEDFIRKEKRYKHFVFVLNKCDLVPSWAVARWLQILSKDHPTVAMHASTTNPFGKGNLINLLRQFSRLHNVTNKASTAGRSGRNPISVGVIGYPNVGKSSVINTLRRKKVCKVAPIPGETKVWQYVMLTRSIYLIDCPGVVYDRERNNDVQAVLKGVVRVERMGNVGKEDMVTTVLQIVKPKDLEARYGVRKWVNTEDFLKQVAVKQGKLLQGGVPHTDSVARNILYDWQRGAIPWFSAPPFESNQKYRDAVDLPEAHHLKFIQNYSSFNIVEDQIVQKLHEGDEPPQEEELSDAVEEDEAEEEGSPPAVDNKVPKGKRTKSRVASTKESNDKVAQDDDAIWSAVVSTTAERPDLKKLKLVRKK